MLGWSNQASAAVQTVFQTLGGLRRAGRAADQFDEDVDVRRLRQFDRVVVPGQIRDIERTRPRARARRNAGHHSLAAGRSEAGLIRQEVQQAAADEASSFEEFQAALDRLGTDMPVQRLARRLGIGSMIGRGRGDAGLE